MPDYTVQEGDCLSKIAQQFGLSSDKVWNHSQNAEIRKLRKDRNVLFPGDVLFIPDSSRGNADTAADKKHNFKRKGVPAKLRLRLIECEEALKNEPYILDIDGTVLTGNTNGDGWIDRIIPPDAKHAVLKLKGGQESYSLRLGHLDPIETTSGIKARLKSLGYYGGAADDTPNVEMSDAIRAFQKRQGLPETGENDTATAAELKREYGS